MEIPFHQTFRKKNHLLNHRKATRGKLWGLRLGASKNVRIEETNIVSPIRRLTEKSNKIIWI